MGRVRVHREPTARADRLRAYRLVVDGRERGTIKEGETLEVELPPGDHRVWMKLDWAKSRELIISGEEDANLRCRGNGNPLLALLYITIWRNDYIALERV